MTHPHYGDVRDELVTLPGYGSDGYVTLDLFTVRYPLIQELAPETVLEIGAYRGYFLVTCLAACPGIKKLGWVDAEVDLKGSNQIVVENVRAHREKHERFLPELWWSTRPDDVWYFGHADLVQVDAAHGYFNAATDLLWAHSLEPRAIFVDDFVAHEPVRRATYDFLRWIPGYNLKEYETVNGLAVLTKED